MIFTALFAAAALQAFTVVDSVSHSSDHFTQGLSFDDGKLLETTGRYGKSCLYKYDANVNVTDSLCIEDRYFGEGSQALGNDIFWLTWKSRKVWKIDKRTMRIKGEFTIPTEGWGLTFYKGELLLSDGSDEIFRVRPEDFQIVGSFKVKDGIRPVRNLNELEVVGDKLYANIWRHDSIAVIDLKNSKGNVERYMDLSEVAEKVRAKSLDAEVLNGIAYDGKFLWITGKLWPVIYKVKLAE